MNSKLVLKDVSRKVDLSTQLTKVSTSVTLKNGGDSSTGHFHLAIEPSLVDKLAFVGVMVSCFKVVYEFGKRLLAFHMNDKLNNSRILCLRCCSKWNVFKTCHVR